MSNLKEEAKGCFEKVRHDQPDFRRDGKSARWNKMVSNKID
jgi:hypothetical protein